MNEEAFSFQVRHRQYMIGVLLTMYNYRPESTSYLFIRSIEICSHQMKYQISLFDVEISRSFSSDLFLQKFSHHFSIL